jgi:hypothetical protein
MLSTKSANFSPSPEEAPVITAIFKINALFSVKFTVLLYNIIKINQD